MNIYPMGAHKYGWFYLKTSNGLSNQSTFNFVQIKLEFSTKTKCEFGLK